MNASTREFLPYEIDILKATKQVCEKQRQRAKGQRNGPPITIGASLQDLEAIIVQKSSRPVAHDMTTLIQMGALEPAKNATNGQPSATQFVVSALAEDRLNAYHTGAADPLEEEKPDPKELKGITFAAESRDRIGNQPVKDGTTTARPVSAKGANR
jgi:hypothetical protein